MSWGMKWLGRQEPVARAQLALEGLDQRIQREAAERYNADRARAINELMAIPDQAELQSTVLAMLPDHPRVKGVHGSPPKGRNEAVAAQLRKAFADEAARRSALEKMYPTLGPGDGPHSRLHSAYELVPGNPMARVDYAIANDPRVRRVGLPVAVTGGGALATEGALTLLEVMGLLGGSAPEEQDRVA